MRTLVWMRADLRTSDNAALSWATRESDRGVVALFVVSPGEWAAHDYAPVRIDLMLRSLAELSRTLAALNIALLVREAPTPADVQRVVLETLREQDCSALAFNREYEWNEWTRDEAITKSARAGGRTVHAFTDQSLLEPGDVRTGEGKYFTVFSPFKRAAIRTITEAGGVRTHPAPRKQTAMVGSPSSVPAKVAGFESAIDPSLWPAGESTAQRWLRDFVRDRITDYRERRDFPGEPGTSRLSPHLAIGTISPRQCVAAAVEANAQSRSPLDTGPEGITHWISEVLWREFYIHILRGFPRVCKHRAFQPATERIVWNDNEEHFHAWCEGRTGVPIVDAAMRQLRTQGWMHNRSRMIAAMYFTKNLFLDFRKGERFFSRHLVDGFLASNNGGWQWSASTGTDAAPYFRIFNPVSQSKKFDPDGAYIRAFVPELRDVEGDMIHEPWTIPALLRGTLDYPEPLVDLSASRTRAIERFQELKG